ncbi:Na+/solute symporter [Violaceomyces palustris]|uniref:Na+/solute symporter n=1 Tax=Violaceomyces palustris TaxID=1673888 RepID=A0ACD0P312_9BASI|nr:Na+/solute symporter [Violaceomyces palustris]
MATVDSIPPPLNQGWGYGVLLGFGLAFAAGMMWITSLLRKYNGENNAHFETYATAGRKIGTGLTATAVFSSWAWSTALLSSTVVTFSFGLAGAYAFASGCLVQISMFALLAIQSKLKTPHAHTILEVVKIRYGTVAHWVYMFFCLANNLIAVSNMLLGASATISALTGMHIVASVFLLPVGVCLYTISGGLRATFLTDWMHSVALLIIVLFLVLKTITNEAIGSPGHLWELVISATGANPIAGNHNGSYLTMASLGATEFCILHTLGNFGLVVMDSSYWQKAYSADIAAAVPGYILGGVLYFGLPWCLGTVMGLAGVALQTNPIWPAFGRMLSGKEQSDGLPLAYAALAVAGKSGAVAVLILIFMAVTSTTSAQLIAVSSIVSSDVYHTYIKTDATDKQVIRVSHLACIGFALFSSGFSVMLQYVGISLTWTLYFLGIITCPAMVTLPLTVLWKKQTWSAAIISPIVGIISGMGVWLGTAYHYGGRIDVETTGVLLPCLWGTVTAAFVPAILSPLITYIKPSADFDWDRFSEIKLISDDDASSLEEKDRTSFTPAQERYMRKQSVVAAVVGVILFLAIWVLWPYIMYASHYEFSRPFFTGWVVVSIIWAFSALLIFTFLPLWDGRALIKKIALGVLGRVPVEQFDEKRQVEVKEEGRYSVKSASNSGSESIREDEKRVVDASS